METSRLWLRVIRSGILSKVHRFTEVSFRDEAAPEGELADKVVPKLFYNPVKRSSKLPWHLLVSESQTLSWPSFSPQSAVAS
eukprot:10495454-Lingulodinium_polyedra.AAC.1